MTNAYFISFEGIDGSGKSTQVKMLVENLSNRGIKVLSTCEPQKGGEVRRLLVQGQGTFTPKEEAEMMFQDRGDHVRNKIKPALARGEWVITDRFADSSRAFQGYGMGVDKDFIEDLYKKEVGDCHPDLTIILDMDPKAGLERSIKKNNDGNLGEDKYEAMGLELQQKVRQCYLDTAKAEPNRCVIVDASGDIDTVQAKIVEVIENRFFSDSRLVANG